MDNINELKNRYTDFCTSFSDMFHDRLEELGDRCGRDLECALNAFADELLMEYETGFSSKEELVDFIREKL